MRRGDENFRHLFGIGVHRRRHRQHHAGNRVRQRPVDKLFGNERLVRHDNLFSVPVADGGRTGINAGDAARQVANGDRIADADRLLKQDNQAGDKVGEDLLQAKPRPTPSAATSHCSFDHSIPIIEKPTSPPTSISRYLVMVVMA